MDIFLFHLAVVFPELEIPYVSVSMRLSDPLLITFIGSALTLRWGLLSIVRLTSSILTLFIQGLFRHQGV